MGRINVGRAILGGLVAGVVLNIGETILNVPILGAQYDAAMQALGVEPVAGAAIAVFFVLGFVLGIGQVWLYAAIRPRFGAGARTAVIAGLAVWAFAAAFPNIGIMVMRLFPSNLLWISLVWTLFEYPLATLAGA
ncbi:MAG: hypothetical protein HY701_05445 [Gemmatimonadetes bacterium]|nr:hypothetical protein [Gemmatimonadota bacterium]